jgi:hypothetical protein
MPDGAVVALNIGVLLRLAWLDMVQGDALVLSPFHEFPADIFRAIVDANGERFSPPFDDLVEAPDDAFSRQRKIHLDAQPLPVEVVQDVEKPELPTVLQAVCHEVHRPDHVRRLWHSQSIGLVPLQS